MYLMEVTEQAPAAYGRFAMRRLFWKELGVHFDELDHIDVVEALTFLDLEQKHPHRFQPKKAGPN